MAIPDSPNWSDINDVKPLPEDSLEYPVVDKEVYGVSIGPESLRNSSGSVNSKFWYVYQESGKVYVTGGAVHELFTENALILDLALGFDQLGRPMVFYQVEGGGLFLFWFNTQSGQEEVRPFGEGVTPRIAMDTKYNTTLPTSDVLLFYVRNDRVYMRVQRDRFDVEYMTPAAGKGILLDRVGLRTDYRFQVTFKIPGLPHADWVPEDPPQWP